MADLRISENETANYKGGSARISTISTGIGLNWSKDVENAVVELGQGNKSAVVTIVSTRLPIFYLVINRCSSNAGRQSILKLKL